MKALNMNTLHDLFSNFKYGVNHITNEEGHFHDTSQYSETSALSSY